MFCVSFLGSDCYQATEQSSPKFMAKINGLLSMAHLVCYKTICKVVHINLNKSLEAKAMADLLFMYMSKYSSLGGSWLPLSIFQGLKKKKKSKSNPLLEKAKQINIIKRTFDKSVENSSRREG